jgi:hypothetical protein
MRRSIVAKLVIGALVLVAVSSLAYALTLQLRLDPGLALRGIWTWNSGSSAVVKVRIEYAGYKNGGDHQPYPPVYPGAANVRLLLKARALDGTTVQGAAMGQIPMGAIREFTIVLPKPVSQLQILQVTRIGSGMPI